MPAQHDADPTKPGTFHQIATPREVKLARAFEDLEGPLEDLRCATIVLESVHQDAAKPAGAEWVRPLKGMVAFILTDDQRDGLAYAVTHVGDLARKLVADLDATLQAEPATRRTELRTMATSMPNETDRLTTEERELLAVLRAEGAPQAHMQLTRRKVGWTVATTRLDGSGSSVGRGESFAEAWRRQNPRER